MKSIIIERPDKRSLQQKLTDNTLKVFLILAGFYLLTPLITFLAWYIAYTFFDQHLILLEGYKEYKTPTSFWYIAIILSFIPAILLWSKINFYFYNKKKHPHKSLMKKTIPHDHIKKISAKQIEHYKQKKRLMVYFTENGQIRKIV